MEGSTFLHKTLSFVLSIDKLSFASSERLRKYLGIEPGSVSLLALINDNKSEVELLIDPVVWTADSLQCHSLVNTATLVIPKEGIEKFLQVTKHKYKFSGYPRKNSVKGG